MGTQDLGPGTQDPGPQDSGRKTSRSTIEDIKPGSVGMIPST